MNRAPPTNLRHCLVPAACALLLLGCRGEEVGGVPGELVVVWTDASGATVSNRDATIAFGPVYADQRAVSKLVVKNLGRGALTLVSLTQVDGTPVRIGGGAAAEGQWFDVAFDEGVTVESGASLELEVGFTPPSAAEKSVEYAARLHLRAQNAPGADEAMVALRGTGVTGPCDLPRLLDFGVVLVDTTWELPLLLDNPTEKDAAATLGAIEGNGAEAYSVAPGFESGTIDLPPLSSRTVTFRFTPPRVGDFRALVKVRAAAQCPERSVLFQGRGVDRLLRWTPTLLEFEYVPVSQRVVRSISLENLGNAPVEITNVRTFSSPDFAPEITDLVVPARGTVEIPVAFTPTAIGMRTAQLAFSTSIQRQATGWVDLRGFGGGPEIEVKPTAVNFGRVAYFASASPPVSQTRRVAVFNFGSRPVPPDVRANLKLGKPGAAGAYGPPYAEIAPANEDTAADEFSVSIAAVPAYDPAKGVEAVAGQNVVEVLVKLTPSSVGRKEAVLKIYSNDFDEPEVTVTVVADAVVVPPCDYRVTPATLDFGVVSPPDYKDLHFTITNRGVAPEDVCIVSDLRTGLGSDPAFLLAEGEVSERELAPGESMSVKIRAWPQALGASAVTPISGSVDFYVSSDVKPQGTVALAADVTTSCITIAPDEIDFGTVQKGCNSVTRAVNVYNVCTNAVKLLDVDMIAGAGQPAGGPDCAGAQDCPEFIVTSSPVIPSGGLVLQPGAAPTTLQVKYTPIDFGGDTGALGITFEVNGGINLTYVVTLAGEGDSYGLNRDVFVQGATPQADILLSIDGSCSMGSKQQELADNMAAFFTQAVQDGVDYRIAVIKGQGPGSNASEGEFLSGPGHLDRILTPSTTNVESQFKAKVAVGASGGDERCFEPSLKALTAPFATGINAGFLRPAAALSIICITDDSDYSPNTVSYYYAALSNIKGATQKTLFSISAIAAFTVLCNSSLLENGRYADMVQKTGGVKEEICAQDWAKALKNVSQTAFGARGTFYLTAPVDLSKGPIQVKIDGVVTPNTTATGYPIWTYDTVTNSLNFDTLYRPGAATTVEITYYVPCF